MADAAVTLLLENLSHLLKSSADLVSGAEDEIQLLRNEVELLRVFLQDAANKLKREVPYREMERQIQKVVDDVHDTIDSCLSQAAAAQSKIDLFRRHRALTREPAHSLTEEVRSLREDKLKPMLEKLRIDFAERVIIGDGSRTIIEEPHQIRVNQVLPIGQDRRVGLEDDQEKIIGYLLERTERPDFISIVGMPGVGKTTVASEIFRSPEIQYEFPTRIWIDVSQDFNRRDVFLNILKEVTSKDMSSVSDNELALFVHDFLEKRRFLLVLDDVWSRAAVYAIRDALPKDGEIGKVLITTRVARIGSYANPMRHPYKLRLLTKDESWKLLQLQVFGVLDACPVEFIKIGKVIADNCDGLPFAVVIVGGILLDQLSKKHSLSALKKEWMELSKSIQLQRDPDHRRVPVALSYRSLPNDLRRLFLYMGVFPEDYKIPATTLTRLWIAEGLIQHREGWSLEDIAEKNLNRLVRRKLVIVDEMRSNGKVKACRLHDLVRDFCISKGSELNLFQEIRKSGKETFHPLIRNLQRHRRLCIHSNPLNFFSSEPYVPDLRSFLCFYKTETLLLPEDTSKIPADAFELLRVLDIKTVRFTRFPLQVTQLFCLKYIVLSSNFKILPEVVSMLRSIQTLIIHTSSRTLEIKADIWKMIHLRHLQTNASIILRNEPENHSDQELQTLTNLSPDNCTDNVFNRARCFKKLGIRGTLSILLYGEVGSRKIDHLEKLKELENLKLLNDLHMVSPSEGPMTCLPPPDKFPPKLRSLTLSATLLSWEHMSILGKLEKVEVLKLKDNAFIGECWEVAHGSFLALQVLQIGYTNLVSWKASHNHFPKLRSLALRNCEKLEALPLGLENAQSLQEIELLHPSKPDTVSARKIKEARQQIKLSIFFPPDE